MAEHVTVVVRRRVKAGREAAYEAWLGRLTAAAHDLPGYVGAELHRPRTGGHGYASAFRFATLANLQALEGLRLRARALAGVAPPTEGDAVWDRLTGLELWFEPPRGTRM